MKKVLLSLLIAGAGLSASAQYNHYDNKHHEYPRKNERGEYDRGSQTHHAAEKKIQAINYKYDAKISKVSHRFGLGARAKRNRIEKLEQQRFAEIQRCKTIMHAHNRDYADRRFHHK